MASTTFLRKTFSIMPGIHHSQILKGKGELYMLSKPQNWRSCCSSSTCWKCGSQINFAMFCEQCHVLQKRDKNLNYFHIFGMTPSFDLKMSELTQKYRKLQSVLHPDKFANSNEEERITSEDYSSTVNRAYSTLQQPLSRGLYMLELQGIQIDEKNVQSDPEFLMALMERNEEVDQAQDETEIKSVIAKNQATLVQLNKEVSNAFTSGDLQKAKDKLIRMRYFISIDTKIKVIKSKEGYVD